MERDRVPKGKLDARPERLNCTWEPLPAPPLSGIAVHPRSLPACSHLEMILAAYLDELCGIQGIRILGMPEAQLLHLAQLPVEHREALATHLHGPRGLVIPGTGPRADAFLLSRARSRIGCTRWAAVICNTPHGRAQRCLSGRRKSRAKLEIHLDPISVGEQIREKRTRSTCLRNVSVLIAAGSYRAHQRGQGSS